MKFIVATTFHLGKHCTYGDLPGLNTGIIINPGTYTHFKWNIYIVARLSILWRKKYTLIYVFNGLIAKHFFVMKFIVATTFHLGKHCTYGDLPGLNTGIIINPGTYTHFKWNIYIVARLSILWRKKYTLKPIKTIFSQTNIIVKHTQTNWCIYIMWVTAFCLRASVWMLRQLTWIFTPKHVR